MRRLYLIPLLVLLIASLMIAGCTKATTPATTTPAPATTSVPAADKVYSLKLAHTLPAPASDAPSFELAYQKWAEGVEKDSNGKVDITIYPAETLLKSSERYDGVLAGVADISHISPYALPVELALNSILELPGLPWTTKSENRIKIIKELHAKYPELQAEFKGFEIMFFIDIPPRKLLFRKSGVVHTPADMKGLRMATEAGPYLEMLELMGATPMQVTFPDMYMALEKGTIDGTFAMMGGVRAAKWYEVSKSYTDVPSGHSTHVVVMNKSVWDELPADIQKIFRNWEEFGQSEATYGMAYGGELAVQEVLKRGQTIYTPTAEEFKLWTAAAQPILEAKIKELEAKGLPARAVIEDTFKLIDQYK